MRSRLAAHRWPATAVAVLVVMVVAVVTRDSQVQLPMFFLPVPTPTMMTVAGVMLVFGPLPSAVPELEPTLLHERSARVVRVGVATVLSVVAMTPTWALTWRSLDYGLDRVLPLFVVLMIVTVLGVSILGDLGWLSTIAVGTAAMMFDARYEHPVTTRLDHVPLGVLLLALVGAGTVYVWHGPRRPVRV